MVVVGGVSEILLVVVVLLVLVGFVLLDLMIPGNFLVALILSERHCGTARHRHTATGLVLLPCPPGSFQRAPPQKRRRMVLSLGSAQMSN